jgi:hypothetical protein
MTVSSQVVNFTKGTGANGTTQDVALTFTPTAIILFTSGGAGANNGTVVAEYQKCVGFSDGTNHAAIAIGSDDGSNAADTGRIHSNADVYIRVSESVPTTTVVARGSCVFQTNNVRFTWTVNDAVATNLTMWAFAGNDITGVKVNTVNITETVDGATEDYTGLGFTPQGDAHTAVFLMGINHTANSSSAPTTTAISMLSCATAITSVGTPSGKQWYMSNNAENTSDPSDTWRVAGGDRNYAIFDTVGAFDHFGFLSAWITDGFRMTWDNAPASSTIKMSYLVINGGNWDSGTLTAPTSATNDVDYAVSVSSQIIRGMMLVGTTNTVTAAVNDNSIYSIGVTDGTTHSTHSSIDEDAQATMDSYRSSTNASVYHTLTANGVLFDRATFDSFSTNNFRLDYPTKSVNAQLIHWVVVADQTTAAAVVEEVFPHSFGKIHTHFDNNLGPAIFG